MTTTPTFSTTLDYTSNRLQHDTSGLRPITLIDDYNPYYTDPDDGFVLYWDTHSCDQHHLCFYNILINKHKTEPDYSNPTKLSIRPLSMHVLTHGNTNANSLTNQLLLGQRTRITVGDHRSLATAVAARFVNTLVTRTREPDHVPLTTNLGHKYTRRYSIFQWISANQI